MNFEQTLDQIQSAYEQVVRENRELRKLADRLGQENNVMCDRVFELEQQLGLRREASNDE